MIDKEMSKHLDNLGRAGVLLYLAQRAKGVSEHEAAYFAIRKTAKVMTEQLQAKLKELTGDIS